MPRIRTTKPEFWSSEQVFRCSRDARLLFIGLWNFCDDAGIIPASPLSLKAKVFPADELDESDIKSWIAALIQNDLLIEYITEGKTYWQVTGWKSHQRIDKPNYRYPQPSTSKDLADDSTNTPGRVSEQSTPIRRSIDESSTTNRASFTPGREGKGREGKGEKIRKVSDETSPLFSSENLDCANTQDKDSVSRKVQEVFEYWLQVMEHPRSKLDGKRDRVIKTAFKNYSIADLKKAIDGCKKTPFNMGDNEQCQRYDELTLILRDATHIERFIHNAAYPPKPSKSAQAGDGYDDLMQGAI